MNITAHQHTVVAVLLFCALLTMANVSDGELLPWSEAVYATCALSIADKDFTLDVQSFAAEERRAFSNAPLFTWSIAAVVALYGPTDAAVRSVPALCAVVCCILMYLLARRFVSREYALIAAVLLAGSASWNAYARMVMPETMTVCLLVLFLWSVVKSSEGSSSGRQWDLLAAVAIGCSALVHVGAATGMALITLGIFFRKGKIAKSLFASVLVGYTLGVSWFIWINVLYETPLFEALASAPNDYSALIKAASPWWFLITTLITENPFIIFALLFVVYISIERRALPSRTNDFRSGKSLEQTLMWAFALGLAGFSALGNRDVGSVAMAAFPAIALSMRGIEEYISRYVEKRGAWLTFSVIIGAIVWSAYHSIVFRIDRADATEVLPVGAALIALIAVAMLTGKFLDSERRLTIIITAFVWISFAVPIGMLGRTFATNFDHDERMHDGAASVGYVLKNAGVDVFIYMYHVEECPIAKNPQLDWYLNGWMRYLQPGKSAEIMALSGYELSSTKMQTLQTNPGKLVVYYLSKHQNRDSHSIIDILETQRPLLLRTQRYAVFGMLKSAEPANVLPVI